MANFFSADYWKALYFKAMGGQETAVDPNAMSGSFAGSATFTATASSTGSSAVDISGSFAGASEFSGNLTRKRSTDAGQPPRKKRQIRIIAPTLQWARDNLTRFLGPNADTTKLDALLEQESSPETVDAPETIASAPNSELIGAEASVSLVNAEEDEDEIIALLLAA